MSAPARQKLKGIDVNPARQRSAAPYQRQRLACGVLGIGCILIALWLSLSLDAPGVLGRWFGGLHPALGGGLTMLLLAAMVSLIQLPFDFVGGRVIEGNFRQIDINSTFKWNRAYAMSLAIWCSKLTVAGAAVGLMWSWFPVRWPVVAGGTLMAIATLQWALPFGPGPVARSGAARKPWLERIRSDLRSRKLPVPVLCFYETGERSLGGGWAGIGSLKRLWVSRTLWELEPKTAAMLLTREIMHDREGHRLLSMLATALWTLAGLVLSSLLISPAWHETAPATVMATAVVMTTWCWFSLLFLWPALGRWQVLRADRGMLEAGYTLGETLATLDLLAERNKPDEDLPAAVAFVFHPIPPMRVRREALALAAQQMGLEALPAETEVQAEAQSAE